MNTTDTVTNAPPPFILPPVSINWKALADPFPFETHKWRVMNVTQNKEKASVAFYIDARDVMNRLDEVAGPANWSTAYRLLKQDERWWVVECTLTICGISRSDVGEGDITEKELQKHSKIPAKDAYCLPLNAQALTKTGWKFHHELAIGEQILAYDMQSDLCRWTPIQHISVFEEPHDVIELSSKSFRIVCTPNHRWVTRRRGRTGSFLKDSSMFDSYDRVCIAAPSEDGAHPLSEREAAIIGWLATDGSIILFPDGRRPSPQFHVVISQSKEPYRTNIRNLLSNDANEYITPPGERIFPGHSLPSPTLERSTFYLNAKFAKTLLKKAEIETWQDLPRLVTRLSSKARGAMLQAMLDGDGHHSHTQIVFGKKCKPGVMEAFEILAAMQGIALGSLRVKDGILPLRTLRIKPHTWTKCLKVSPVEPRPVWCPSTKFGTWVTRWDNTITITGNSDALKRAAVQFGIGRYLYAMDTGRWFPIDQYQHFTPDAEKQIRELLAKNLGVAAPTAHANGSLPQPADTQERTLTGAITTLSRGDGKQPHRIAVDVEGKDVPLFFKEPPAALADFQQWPSFIKRHCKAVYVVRQSKDNKIRVLTHLTFVETLKKEEEKEKPTFTLEIAGKYGVSEAALLAFIMSRCGNVKGPDTLHTITEPQMGMIVKQLQSGQAQEWMKKHYKETQPGAIGNQEKAALLAAAQEEALHEKDLNAYLEDVYKTNLDHLPAEHAETVYKAIKDGAVSSWCMDHATWDEQGQPKQETPFQDLGA